jgi:hypothetical protein
VNFWHYTCDHGHRGISVDGKLVTPVTLAKSTAYERWPAWRRALLDIIWMTDLDAPDRAALGLTRNTIPCDRTAHRYRVVGYNPIRYADFRRDLPKRLRDHLEEAPGVLPMHWWMAYTPVPVVYDPILAVVS